MYRVMLVDDEAGLRNLMRVGVDWNSLDMEIKGEAASGIEAINLMEDVCPDIMFVDVQMPYMDGIELSKWIRKRYPAIRIIILTAYQDFKYAKECVGIGVTEYLLKPLVMEDLFKACKKAIMEIEENRKLYGYKDTESRESSANIHMNDVKNYVMENFQSPSLNVEEIAEKYNYNSSYLSRRFKEKTGQKLSEFINNCRMEKAITYAKQGIPMYQTANLVGVPDPHYFSRCFKKYTGETYSEYGKEKK